MKTFIYCLYSAEICVLCCVVLCCVVGGGVVWCGVVWFDYTIEFVHILVLYRMYAGDGEQRPLTDPPGDVISMSAIYVVTGSKGITVRDGMEATSQEILVLHPGEFEG